VVGPEDSSDILQDAVEDEAEHTRVARFRQRAALLVGVLAAMLAITALGGDDTTKEIIDSTIQSSDTYAFYQAKNIRQTENQLAADNLEAQILLTNPPDAVKTQLQQRIDKYKATVARYESEPETGEGKKELLTKAQDFVNQRDEAQERDPNFDYAQALLQISIVLGSVAIVSVNKGFLGASGLAGVLGIILMINGYKLLFDLPI
jgi:hypothetical protein